jgi:hypothetical protein
MVGNLGEREEGLGLPLSEAGSSNLQQRFRT